jgi:hypothetical protein
MEGFSADSAALFVERLTGSRRFQRLQHPASGLSPHWSARHLTEIE